MIAASIIAGRALQPLEGMIEGWRSLVQTRAAYTSVWATVEAAAERAAASAAAAPAGAADRRQAALSAARQPRSRCSTASASSCNPVNRWRSSARPAPASRRWRASWLDACCRPRARCGSTAPSCATGTAGSSASTPATCRRRSSCFPGTIKENVCRMRNDLPDDRDLQRRGARRRPRHDLPPAERLRDRARAQRCAALRRPEAAHCACARLLRRAVDGRARRAQLQSRRRRRAGADGDAAAGQGTRSDDGRHHPAPGPAQHRRQGADPARRPRGSVRSARRSSFAACFQGAAAAKPAAPGEAAKIEAESPPSKSAEAR